MKKFNRNFNSDGGAGNSDGGNTAGSGQDNYSRYTGMSREELMSEMYKEAAKSRAGGMSNGDLDDFYNKVSPAMTEEQRANLRNLIDRLKI